MKRVHPHKNGPSLAPKTRKKRTSSAKKSVANGSEERIYTAPIFNTGLAGSVLKYDRPFDPVWPTRTPKK